MEKPVPASIQTKKSVLITGSNVSGKSTFIKAAAINTILAQTTYAYDGYPKYPEAIVKAGPLLRHVHVAEYGSRLFPGHDPALVDRLRPFFDALLRSGYSGGVSCECGWGDAKDFAKNAKTAIETMKGLI